MLIITDFLNILRCIKEKIGKEPKVNWSISKTVCGCKEEFKQGKLCLTKNVTILIYLIVLNKKSEK